MRNGEGTDVNADPRAVADRLWVKDHLDPEEKKLRFSKWIAHRNDRANLRTWAHANRSKRVASAR